MPDYGACYDSTGSRCSGRPQPGTLALQAGVQAVFPTIGSYGIYNCRPSSAGGGLSTHGEGRGWDAACNANTHRRVGDDLAERLIANHRKLGIQRIIWNRRQTDVRNGIGNWRKYGGPSPHTDHLHIELCWNAARDNPLTKDYVREILGGQEDDLPYTEEQLKKIVADALSEDPVITTLVDRVRRLEIRTRLNYVADDGTKPETLGNVVKEIKDKVEEGSGG